MEELCKQIEHYLKSLKLHEIVANYRTLSVQATEKKLTYEEYLLLLLKEELQEKTSRSIQTKISKARFPFLKTIESFDFSFQPTVNERDIIRLTSCEFIEKQENILLLGPPGVGKTHLAVGLGVKACMAKFRVCFISARSILEDLLVAQKIGQLAEKILYYSRLDLLIIDELGYMPITKEEANLFFQVVSSRYEKGSIILTSNYGFNEWGKIFPDDIAASAIIDRLVHHSGIFYINGASYRLKDKLRRDGGNPAESNS
jgi:DNA replication protein DnaC